MYSYSIQILDASHNSHGHFPAISRCFRARIQGRPEAFTDLLHASLQLIALEKDDEDRLVYLISLDASFSN